MRAVVLHRYGGPDVVSVEERPAPTLDRETILGLVVLTR
jgi:hypothetical protein